MGEADRKDEETEQRYQRRLARTALAALSIDVQQGGGNDQKRRADDAIRNGVEQDEAGRHSFGWRQGSLGAK